MKKVTVKLATKDPREDSYPVRYTDFECWQPSNAPGLVVHRMCTWKPAPFPAERVPTLSKTRNWTVSHVGSGRRVVPYFDLKGTAETCAERIAPLADWTQSYDDLEGDRDLYEKVIAVVRDLHAMESARRAR